MGVVGFRHFFQPSFDPDQVCPEVRDFYEHAARYSLEAWSEVTLLMRFFLWGLVTFASRRMQQLNFPVSSMELANGAYLGRGTARTLRLLPDGTVLSDRAFQKIRSGERGWCYAAALLENAGARPPEEDRIAWLKHWLPRVTRSARHPGNYRYAWKSSSLD